MGSIIPGIADAGAGAGSETDFDEPRASFGSLLDFDADLASGAGAGFGSDLDGAFTWTAGAGVGCASIGEEPRALRECADGAGSTTGLVAGLRDERGASSVFEAECTLRGVSLRAGSRVFDEEVALRGTSVTILCELRRAAATSAGWGASTTRGVRARGSGANAGCSACTDGSVRSRGYAGATYDGCSSACGTWDCTADRCTYGAAGVAWARSRVGGSVVRS